MALARLEVLANRVRRDLEKHYHRRPAQLRRALRELLHMLVTAQTPADLDDLAEGGEIRGLRTHLDGLQRHLRRSSQLPEALCAVYKYLAPAETVRRRYGVRPRVWSYFHDLAKELAWDPALHIAPLSYDHLPWHDVLEERFVEIEVVLEARALEGMLICALEGYLSPRKARRKGYEVYGINLGMTREVRTRTRREGVRIKKYVSVARSHPQLSADAEYAFVVPNARSLEAVLTAAATFHPHYQVVGDFHSHPYDEFSDLESRRGWEFAPSDEQSNRDLMEVLGELNQRLLVTFVIALARCKQRVSRRRYRGMGNTLQISVGDCRVIVAVYRSLGSGRLTKSNISLQLSGTDNGD